MTLPDDYCHVCELSPSDVETTASHAMQEMSRLRRRLRARDAAGRLLLRRLDLLALAIAESRVESPRDRTRIKAHLDVVRRSAARWSSARIDR